MPSSNAHDSCLLNRTVMAMLKKNLTPAAFRCSFGGCPAVFELEDGRLAIIGKKPAVELKQELASITADDEYAIVIPPELLSEVLSFRDGK